MNDQPTRNSQNTEELQKAKTVKKFFSTVGLALVTFLLVCILAQNLLYLIIGKVLPAALNEWWFTWLLSLVPIYCFAMPAMLLVLSRLGKTPHISTYDKKIVSPDKTVRYVSCDKPKMTAGLWLTLMIVAFGAMYIGNFIGNYVMSILSLVTGYDYANGLVSLTENSPTWVTVIFACICAPIGEEFVFRKLLIDRTRKYGDVVAILISAVSFGLFHGNLYQFFYALFLGAVFGYMYTLTGKLRWNVIAHSVINLIGGVAVPYLASWIDTETLSTGNLERILESVSAAPFAYVLFAIYSVLVYAFMIASVIILVVGFKKIALSRGEVTLESDRMLGAVLLNGGMFTAFVLFTLYLVLGVLPL